VSGSLYDKVAFIVRERARLALTIKYSISIADKQGAGGADI
jgi:hypothetical protein